MESIEKRIAEIIGEASMLWSETPTGVFQSDRAIELSDEVMNNIKKPIDEIYTFAVNHFTNEQEKFEFFKWWSEKYYPQDDEYKFKVRETINVQDKTISLEIIDDIKN